MAWNEPGGSQKNPWGKRPGKSGGDDALRKFQRKLDNILKGAGAGGPSGTEPDDTEPADNRAQLLIVAGVVVAFWMYQSFFTIDQAERGVVQRFGQFASVRDPGLGFHFWPIERVTKVNTQKVNSVTYTAKVLT
ncbi:MAG: FtsH protease modulator HflK, partial [Pseudomonadota bacterium]